MGLRPSEWRLVCLIATNCLEVELSITGACITYQVRIRRQVTQRTFRYGSPLVLHPSQSTYLVQWKAYRGEFFVVMSLRRLSIS